MTARTAVLTSLQPFLRAGQELRRAYWRRRLGSLGAGGKISRTAKIYAPSAVLLGDDCFVNDFVHIWGTGGVTIGDSTMVAAHTVITSQGHDPAALSQGLPYWRTNTRAAVVIGSNVWIGSNVTILPGVTIGDDAIVAAGAVVTKSVASRTMVGGIPAVTMRDL